jgi:hypothetical protein
MGTVLFIKMRTVPIFFRGGEGEKAHTFDIGH